MGDEGFGLVGMDGAQSVGLPKVGSDFGQKLVVGYPGRGNQVQFLTDACLDFPGDVNRQVHAFLVFRDIQKGFIQ